ncbi:NADase-type glycan-binding domain-containing protein, partial [Nocardioides zeicaulis]
DPPVQAADPTPVPPLPPAPPVEPARSVQPVPSARRRPVADRAPGTEPAPVPTTWDPERDLLPYHDSDELGPDDPLGARGWIPWVVGAVVLVAVVVVLLRVFDSEPVAEPTPDDTAAAAGASPSDDPGPGDGASDPASDDSGGSDPAAPEGTGPRTDVATAATFAVPATAPPTTDLDGNLVAYDAAQMGDGTPSTTWRTAGDATGQTITITLAEPTVLDRVGLVNGYAKQVAGVDWYPNNRRILAVTWGFDDGTTVQQTLAERAGLQRLKVPPVETSTVTLRIDEVTPPGSGPLGRDYTAISEVSLVGRRAG